MSHGDSKIADLLRAALVHRQNLFFKTFTGEPQTRFECCDQLRPKLFCQSQQVAHMVGMSMGQKNSVKPGRFF
jgi:hypothetical protein